MEQSNGDEQTDVNNGLSLSSPPPATHRVYQWPLIQTAEEQQAEKSVLASQKVISPDQESRVHKVTCDLVQWAKDLVGPYLCYLIHNMDLHALACMHLSQVGTY